MLLRLSLAGTLRATRVITSAVSCSLRSSASQSRYSMSSNSRPVGTRPNDAKTGPKGQPMEPIPSASLVVLCPISDNSSGDTRYATLTVQRSARDGSSFRLAVVFPGGALDLADEDAVQRDRPESDDTEKYHHALRLCALRETFEETGLLLVPADDPSGMKSRAIGPAEAGIQPEEWAKIREEIHNDARAFPPFLSRIAKGIDAAGTSSEEGKSTSLLPPLAPISHHSNWVTPRAVVRPAKRFDAHFFLTVLDKADALGPLTSAASRAGSDKNSNLLNLSADGTETTSLRLATSEEMIELAVRDQIVLYPPQFYILADLAASLRQNSSPHPSLPPLIFRHPSSENKTIITDGKGVTPVEEEPRGLHPESTYQFEKRKPANSSSESNLVTSVEPCALPSSGANVSKTTLEWRKGNGEKKSQIGPNTPAKAHDQDGDDDDDEPFVFPLVLPGDHLASPDQQAMMSGSKANNKMSPGQKRPLNRVYVTPRSREDGGGLIVRGARRRNLPGLIDFEEGAQLEEMGVEEDDDEEEKGRSSSTVGAAKL